MPEYPPNPLVATLKAAGGHGPERDWARNAVFNMVAWFIFAAPLPPLLLFSAFCIVADRTTKCFYENVQAANKEEEARDRDEATHR
jgi:hypothetical protein